jgi:hypothetical protein
MPFQRKSGCVKGLSNELMQLRKICQHAFLFESVEDKINPGFINTTAGWINLLLLSSSGLVKIPVEAR